MACYLITVLTGSFVNSLFFVFRNDVIDNKITEIQFRLLIKSCWFHDKILFNALILKGNLFQNWNLEWSNGMCSLKLTLSRTYYYYTLFTSSSLRLCTYATDIDRMKGNDYDTGVNRPVPPSSKEPNPPTVVMLLL